MLLIYIPYKTQRIEYTWDFILNKVVKVNFRLTTSVEEFNQYFGPKFEYSSQKNHNSLWLWASNLLQKSDLSYELTEKKHDEWGYVLFPADNEFSFLPFDLPSAVFWIISRFEEYKASNTDIDLHGRYNYNGSWLYQRKLIDKPIVNLWIEKFVLMLKTQYPNLHVEQSKYSFISTIDIDNMYACKGKSFITNIAGSLKSLFHGRYSLALNRLTYFFTKKDIYDNYNEILELHKTFNIKPVFFVLTSKQTLYDRNLLPENTLFIKTIDLLKNNAHIGVHFSYFGHELNTFEWEKKTLENITQSAISMNRFHYLRYRLPDSYLKLLKLEISSDFSMMYSQIKGFRAGTCTPFYFFDLNANKQTNLKIFSSPFMDKHFIKTTQNEEELFNEIFHYIKVIKNFGGTFVLLWHNETFLEKFGNKFKGRDVYKRIIEYAV